MSILGKPPTLFNADILYAANESDKKAVFMPKTSLSAQDLLRLAGGQLNSLSTPA